MDDEELRSEFAALVASAQQIPVPDSLGLRRRVRRRRAGQATASALACACVAISFALLSARSPAPAVSAQTQFPGIPNGGECASRDLVANWLPPAQVHGVWAEAPPRTYLLQLRNAGSATCSLIGWPRLLVTALTRPKSVTVRYQTHFDEWVGTLRTRVVEPVRIVLHPGATAVSVVNVGAPIAVQSGCLTKAWLVEPPTPGDTPLRSRGHLPQMCDASYITESPLYPPSVPITRNYIPIQQTVTATLRATPRG